MKTIVYVLLVALLSPLASASDVSAPGEQEKKGESDTHLYERERDIYGRSVNYNRKNPFSRR